MNKAVVVLVSFLTVIAIFSTPAFAQRETESEVPSQELEQVKQREAAAAKAKQRKQVEAGKKVTFEQVLADPDNIDLNYLYAQSQVERGDVLGASATLERILLINPNLAKVRLFYAIVLFRLDNWAEAEAEFRSLLEMEMPKSLRSEIKDYLREIKLRQKRTLLSVRQSVGFQYDDNRNAVPSTKKRLFGDFATSVSALSAKEGDTSFLNLTTVGISHDLGFQARHHVFADYTFFRGEQTELDFLDILSHQMEVGGTLDGLVGGIDITSAFFMSHVLLSAETFMRTQGGRLTLERSFLKDRVASYVTGRLMRQDFSGIDENRRALERSGDQLDVTAGIRFPITKTMRGGFYYAFADKDAKEEYNAYSHTEVGFDHTWLLGKGQFVINSLKLGHDNYEAPDLAISVRNRNEKNLRYTVTYGAPLEFFLIGKILPRPLKDTTFTFSYSYYRAVSNVTNFAYRNNKLQLMLTKSWEF